ncbi:MAG: DUF479 domain-containing protein [Spirochaetes bacterium]|nr:DUF479 domain-containing protein [Spirochaetota bacterium]MBN2772064.1 DUF479 domain-containing protein [Spirochaetota bacterium]
MNFLSHYHIQSIPDNNEYSIGVTLPDIISLYQNPKPISSRIITDIADKQNISPQESRLVCGMNAHYQADKIFHTSPWFTNSMQSVCNLYTDVFNKHLPQSLSHILVEILLDKFLIENNPEIISKFYDQYQKFNIKTAHNLFERCAFYDKSLFEKSFTRFKTLRYIENYRTYSGIAQTLKQISERLDIKTSVNFDLLSDFISSSYRMIEGECFMFFDKTQKKMFKKSRC